MMKGMIENRMGPRVDLCGTPHIKGADDETWSLIKKPNVQLDRWDFEMKQWRNLWKQTVRNAPVEHAHATVCESSATNIWFLQGLTQYCKGIDPGHRCMLICAVVSFPGADIINTNCSAAHTRQALCCKMSVEYDKFIESQKKWVKSETHWLNSRDVKNY